MKKFLSAISFILAVIMVMALVPASVFAEDAGSTGTAWTAPAGITSYNATALSTTPAIDGTISSGEYGTAYSDVAAKRFSSGGYFEVHNTETLEFPFLESDFDFYFAYDEDYFYFAFYEDGAEWADGEDGDTITVNNYKFRNNMSFLFGVNMNDASQHFRFGGMNVTSNDNNSIRGMQSHATGTTYNFLPYADHIIEELKVMKYAKDDNAVLQDATLTSQTGAVNASEPFYGVLEMKVSKDKLIALQNEIYGTDITSADAFYFALSTSGYNWGDQPGKNVSKTNVCGYFSNKITPANYTNYGITTEKWFPSVIKCTGNDIKVYEGGNYTSAVEANLGTRTIATEKKTPTFDGRVTAADGYFVSKSYTNAGYGHANNTINPTMTSSVVITTQKTGADAISQENMQAMVDTEKSRISYSWDDDYYYVAFEHITGNTANAVNVRPQYTIVFNFSPLPGGEVYAFTFDGNGWNSVAASADGVYDKTEYINTANSGYLTSARDTYGKPFKDINNAYDVKVTKYVKATNPTVVGDFSDYTTKLSSASALSIGNGFAKNTHLVTFEFKFNKAELAKVICGSGATKDDLGTSMWLAPFCQTVASVATDGNATSVNTPRAYPLMAGSIDTSTHSDVTSLKYTPALMVFGEDECVNGHTFTENVFTPEYLKEGTTYYARCVNCKVKSTTVTFQHTTHTYDQSVIADAYKADAPTCTVGQMYYKSCLCGAHATTAEKFEDVGTALGHKLDNVVLTPDEGGTTHYYACERCGISIAADTKLPCDKENHTFDATNDACKNPVAAYVKGEATCTGAAQFWLACSKCGASAEDHPDAVAEAAGKDVWWFETVANGHTLPDNISSDGEGHWYDCAVCGADINAEKAEITAPIAHVYFENDSDYQNATYEVEANKVTPLDCNDNAVYNKLCTVCGIKAADDTTANKPEVVTFVGATDVSLARGHVLVNKVVVSDGSYHWYVCERDDCDDIVDVNGNDAEKALHSYTVKNSIKENLKSPAMCENDATFWFLCDVCNASAKNDALNATDTTREFFYDVEGNFVGHLALSDELMVDVNADPTVHYRWCSDCEQKVEVEKHTYDKKTVANDYLVPGTEATCKAGLAYYYSCECGAKGNEIFYDEATINVNAHSFSNSYKGNETHHWKECTLCGATSTLNPHVKSDLKDACKTCGAAMAAPVVGGGGAVVTPPADTTAPADTTVPADTTAPADTTPAVTTPADTTAPETTAPETTAPVTDAPTEPETTAPAESAEDTAAVTEPSEGGCGSMIGFAGLAIVAALGACATVVAKKKED